MPAGARQGESFGAVASQYDRARPRSLDPLIDAVLKDHGPSAHGAGSGVRPGHRHVDGDPATIETRHEAVLMRAERP